MTTVKMLNERGHTGCVTPIWRKFSLVVVSAAASPEFTLLYPLLSSLSLFSFIFLFHPLTLSPLPCLRFNTPRHLEARAAGPAALPTAAQTPSRRGGASSSGWAAGRGPSGKRLPQGRRPAPAPPRQSTGGEARGQAEETQLSAGKQQRDEAEADHPSPGEVLLRHLSLTSPVPDRGWGKAPGISEVLEVARGEKRASSCGWSNSRVNSDLLGPP